MTNCITCTSCTYQTQDLEQYYCPQCWGPVRYQRARAGKAIPAAGIWRYQNRLPQEIQIPERWTPGATPLLAAPQLAEQWGVAEVWIKDETANPTHSFKDRVVGVALARALHLGLDTLACTSTGNLGHSLAAACARQGLGCVVLVPDTVERSKIAAAAALGAQIVPIQGSYDDVNRTAHLLADQTDWGWVNMTLRPFYAEGSKTLLWEILDELDGIPDHVVAPAASGSLYSKLHAAARQVGIQSIRFHAAQAGGCSPIAQAYQDAQDVVSPVRPQSRAHSLAIGNPADGINALRAAQESGGSIVAVAEEDLPRGVSMLAQQAGVLTESAGAVTTLGADILAEQGVFSENDRIVLVITGDGLKGMDLVEDAAQVGGVCDADPESVLGYLAEKGQLCNS